jgi:hypothetical protein
MASAAVQNINKLSEWCNCWHTVYIQNKMDGIKVEINLNSEILIVQYNVFMKWGDFTVVSNGIKNVCQHYTG